ncbi:globin domain-containing protein [Massilia sp. CF038]|uniref:globin domain-containing protein n=1 Tax=Massilia sp. CF038 TaxID=1881045 RepID=UPI00091E6500|nr:globin domain-containing protein [Massilia sp. CF038]SHH56493.1 nitric oxide dioxygenase [Massilia sp. CF038]
MISSSARPYIDASVPVLRAHGLAITTAFYQNIFAELPQLTNLFNMGNQANGAQQQSLASAVFAYAANIGNPDALGPVVNRIVHKHVSVGVRAEHYPIVGRHLLGAIAQVLGDAATPPLLAAWDEAYTALATIFINAEKALYADNAMEPGQTRSMRVTEVALQGEDVLAIRISPADGGAAPAFKAGQYLSVKVDFGDGRQQIRQYSLSDAPRDGSLRISVKRDGEVSNWIHQHVTAGSELQVSPPFGDFTIDTESNEPVVLLSAGVGITPMIAALNRIAQVNPGRYVIFGHAARDRAHQAHQGDLAAARAAMPNLQIVTFYEKAEEGSDALAGRMEVARLPSWPRSETNVFLCGPLPFMQAQWQALVGAGVPVTRLHREVFGPEALDHLL